MLSKYVFCWNSRAVSLFAGLRVRSLDRSSGISFGNGRVDKNPFPALGVVLGDERRRLYVLAEL